MTHSSPVNAVTVTIIAQGDNENTPAEAVHHGLEYARKAGFIEAWSDPVVHAQSTPDREQIRRTVLRAYGFSEKQIDADWMASTHANAVAKRVADDLAATTSPYQPAVATAVEDSRSAPAGYNKGSEREPRPFTSPDRRHVLDGGIDGPYNEPDPFAQPQEMREALMAAQAHLLKYTGGFAANGEEAALFAKINAALTRPDGLATLQVRSRVCYLHIAALWEASGGE
jgi:hypothetical protein